MKKSVIITLFCCLAVSFFAENNNAMLPSAIKPKAPKGYKLVWNDEFNRSGKPDSTSWNYEQGFVRNEELQWYQSDNANCTNGVLKIEGRHEKHLNPNYDSLSTYWKTNRATAEYTSSSVTTAGKRIWQYGRFEVRAKIPAVKGSWPAIWTLGVSKQWPAMGEVDLMEFYPIKDVPSLLANAAWGSTKRGVASWDSSNKPLAHFEERDADWASKFHVWRMDWDKDYIRLYLDNELMNEIDLSKTVNPDGFNPFHQAHYLLLNLAIGATGGDPTDTLFPIVYEVDYVRVYQQKEAN